MIIVFVGASGSGKTTLGSKLLGKENELVSFTTRKKRKGENEGKDYYFINKETFVKKLSENAIFEFTIYNGNYYGMLYSEIEKETNKLKYAVLDFEGYKKLKQAFPEKVLGIYISVPKEILYERMSQRGDSAVEILDRFKLYDKEIVVKESFEHIVENTGTIHEALEKIKKIIF